MNEQPPDASMHPASQQAHAHPGSAHHFKPGHERKAGSASCGVTQSLNRRADVWVKKPGSQAAKQCFCRVGSHPIDCYLNSVRFSFGNKQCKNLSYDLRLLLD